MDTATANTLKKIQRGERADSAAASKALDKYYGSFYNRKMNPGLEKAIKESAVNMYTYMWGEQDFMCTGTLKDYDRIPDLPKIKIPVLLTAGEFDAARPSTVQRYARQIPDAKFVMIKNAGHSTMNDNTEEDLQTLRTFLREH